MVKIVSFVKRRNGLDKQDFLDRWRNEHVPLVERMPGLRRQLRNLPFLIPGREPPFDLVWEAWWDDPEQARSAQASPSGQAAGESYRQLADSERSISVVVKERVIIEPPTGGNYVKTLVTLNRRPDLTIDQFSEYWGTKHAKIVVNQPGMLGYVQCTVVPGPGETPPFDGVPMAWYKDLDSNRLALRSPAIEAAQSDEPNFMLQTYKIKMAMIEERED